MQFDPGGELPKKPNNEQEVPSGEYLLALVWFDRKISREKGTEYFRTKYQVCSGELRGAAFFSMLGVDGTKYGTARQWQEFAQSVGVKVAFELGSMAEGNTAAADAEIKRLFTNIPFLATVVRKSSGQYTNSSIKRFLPPETMENSHRREAQEWSVNRGTFPDPDDEGNDGIRGGAGWESEDEIPF
jgi:hypothetical protein